MPAGFFTETAVVLFEHAPSFDAVASCVRGEARAVRDPSDVRWFAARDAVRVIDPARNGRLVVDVIASAWPDDMGDPQRDAMLFGAWTMGAFGRFTQPDALARARGQAWGHAELAARSTSHHAFVRIRTTYVIGGGDDAPIAPEGRSLLGELDAIWETALAVLALPGAIAFFDPTAELLVPAERVARSIAQARERNEPPIDLLVHPRLFRLDGERFVMDSLGMERAAIPDVELLLAPSIDPTHGAGFILDVSQYHFVRGAAIAEGHTIDGPGGRYHAEHGRNAVAPPARPVVRLAL
jgi:hypothetical protein